MRNVENLKIKNVVLKIYNFLSQDLSAQEDD